MTGLLSRTRMAARTAIVVCAAGVALGGPVAAAQAAGPKPLPQTAHPKSPPPQANQSDSSQPAGSITGHKTH